MIAFLSDEVRRNPYPLYHQMRSFSPVFKDPQSDLWMIFDYDGVKRAMNDHGSFSSVVSPVTGRAPDWLVFNDPPRHSRRRAIIMRAFTPRSIANLEPRIRAISRELLDPLVERKEMDLAVDYAGPLPVLVIAEMLGIPASDRQLFLRWSDAIVNLSYSIAGGAEAARMIVEHGQAKAEMVAYVPAILEQRRRDPKDDLLTRLVEAEIDGERLTDLEILGFFQLLLSAATETTVNLIDNAVLCLMENPAELARLRGEPELLPAAIEEVLRYRSPGQMMFRSPTRDVEIGGKLIPQGKLVLAMVGSANRDPKYFAAPDRFDIGRDPNPHIAFGHGIHFCLGAPLARLEGRIALEDLLARMETFEPVDDRPWEPRKALHVHGPARLPIRFTTAKGSAAPA